MPYRTVFEITQQGYSWYLFFLCLSFGAITSILMFSYRGLPQKKRTLLIIFSTAVVLLGSAAFGNLRSQISNTRAYREGRYQTVEGNVTNFVPMPYNGHALESFTVNGVKFSYTDWNFPKSGFKNTSSHGGPIREGLPVRIGYIGNTIVKLEIQE
jgi:hypothetical protein